MNYKKFYLCDDKGNSNCVLRSFSKMYNEEYDNVYNELCNISKTLNSKSFNDIEVFEYYMKKRNTFAIKYGKNLKVKDLKLDNKKYIIFCYDKKAFYHMVPIINNTLYDKDDSSLDLYVIKVYENKMNLSDVDIEIHNCDICKDMVEKFPNSKTVSIGKSKDIVILGEAPANNGWRKSGIAWYDINHKLLPSGVVLQKLLAIINISLEDTYFLEAIKCFPKERKYLSKCSNNCKEFLFKQLDIINPKIVLALGDAATKTILDIKYKKFSDVVGKTFDINGYKVIPIYHPSPISPMSYKSNIEIFKNIKI